MRLHLDPSTSSSKVTEAGPPNASAGGGSAGLSRSASGPRDNVALSGPSSVLNRAAVDRAARIQQLTESVRSDSYRPDTAAISAAIVTHAAA